MKVLADPVFRTTVLSGIAVGVGTFGTADKFPVLSGMLAAAWAMVAGFSVAAIVRRRREG